MIRIENSIVIHPPLETVWSFVSNPDNSSKYDYGAFKCGQPPMGPIGVGSIVHTQRQFLGRQLSESVRVSEYVPNRVMAFQFSGGTISGQSVTMLGQNRMTFQPVEDGTRMAILSEIALGGWLKLMTPTLAWVLTRASPQNLANVKRILEATE